MTADPVDLETTEDAVLGGRLRLQQPRRGHRFGHDAVLLAAATAARPGDRVVEFGAGVGLVGLAVAARVPGATVTLLDVDPRLVALASQNAARNGLAERVRALALDVTGPARAFAAAGLMPDTVQRVMMNPPYNDPSRSRPSPDADRASAHAAASDTLAAWCKAAARLLVSGGVLTLIWRADGLAKTLAAIGRQYGGVAILPVHPRPGAAAIRVIVSAEKGSRAPDRLLPGLILNGPDGRPTPEAEAVLRSGATLPLAEA